MSGVRRAAENAVWKIKLGSRPLQVFLRKLGENDVLQAAAL